MVCEVEHASLLTECRADTSRKLGEVVRSVEQAVSLFPLTLVQGIIPFRALVAERACPMAERYSAVHAAACLRLTVVSVESLFYLSKVLYSIVNRTVAGFYSRHLHECFQFSHDCCIIG